MILDGYEIPIAEGDPAPAWPLASDDRRITADFGRPRADGRRIHVAEDLPAPEGTVVLAPESGTVTNVHEFTSRPSSRADTEVLLLATDTGLTIALGEILPGSWSAYGIVAGARVRKGQPIARVGGLGMLHLEIYRGTRRTTSPWWHGRPPPDGLLDPAEYLHLAARGTPAIVPHAPTPPIPGWSTGDPLRSLTTPRGPGAGGSGGDGLGAAIAIVIAVAMFGGFKL